MNRIDADDQVERILAFLVQADPLFMPSLSARVELPVYAEKLSHHAVNLFVAGDGVDKAHAAFYLGSALHPVAFLSSFCVLPAFRHERLSDSLLAECIREAESTGMAWFDLEVGKENERAIAFYRRHGFEVSGEAGPESWTMRKLLAGCSGQAEEGQE